VLNIRNKNKLCEKFLFLHIRNEEKRAQNGIIMREEKWAAMKEEEADKLTCIYDILST
jgi:hypothetical protein